MSRIIKPSATLYHATPEQAIPHISRACYQSYETANESSDERLMRHFKAHDESPLEFAWACMDITCSYAAHVHLLRHRFFSFQWRSQRYDETLEFVYPAGVEETGLFLAHYVESRDKFERMRKGGYGEAYKKQDARYLIPQGIAVQGFMAGNARAWLNFLKLRTSKKAMPETREIALQIEAELLKAWPQLMGGNK